MYTVPQTVVKKSDEKLRLDNTLSINIWLVAVGFITIILFAVVTNLLFLNKLSNQSTQVLDMAGTVITNPVDQHDLLVRRHHIRNAIDETLNINLLCAALALLVGFSLPFFLLQKHILNRVRRLSEHIRELSGELQPGPDGLLHYIDEIDEFEKTLAVMKEHYRQQQLQRTELEQARAMAEAATRTKSEFLANVGHEIRTPLAAVIGYLDIANKHTDLHTRELLVKARSAAVGLLAVLNDILDVSKIEAGKVELEIMQFDLTAVLNELGNIGAIMAEKKNISLVFDFPLDTPPLLRGDPLRLSQILMNLLSNAIKFTERGTVVVAVYHQPIDEHEVGIEFSVLDTGIGIEQNKIEQLFESFTQADGDTTRKYGGTGLGLSITKRLVALMGGRLFASSEPGKGSCFKAMIPFPRVLHQEVPTEFSSDFRHLVIVDHNETESAILRKNLGLLFERVNSYASLEELSQAIESGLFTEHPPSDVVVSLDTLHGGLDLAEGMLQVFRKQSVPPRIAAMISHLQQSSAMPRLVDLGISQYILKPFDVHRLIDALRASEVPVRNEEPAVIQRWGALPLLGTRVLVAEDSDALREITTELLSALGAEVDGVVNGREAVVAVNNPIKNYDLVLMDIQMPVMDGLQATREIRTRFDKSILPILALTSHTLEPERQRCLDAGMNDHLSKPIDVQRIAEWILCALKNRQAIHQDVSLYSTLNMADALRRLSGNHELLVRMLRRFVEDYRGIENKIDRQIAATADLRTLAHTLKGVAGTIGAARVAHLAQALEESISQSSPDDDTDALCHDLKTALADLFTTIEQQLSKETQ
jgi:two-component system sensor histidine kinase/response regulator